jgi:3-phosphoglycerate kinase
MKTIDDFAVAGLRVLVRADLNVPLDGGASLEFIEGKTLPGLAALEES